MHCSWYARGAATLCAIGLEGLATWMAPSICEFCTEPELLKVQEIFSTMSTKISSRTLPSVLEVSRMDLMTPVGPLAHP